MIFVDDKYIGMISSRLNKFAKKKNGLYNFRCPYCGDSQKHKNKARGYLYIVKNDYNFKCHNCGTTRTLANFLKDQDSVIHDQYIMERYKRGATGKRSNTAAPKFKFEKPVFKKKQELNLNKVVNLNKEHPARTYLEQNRQLPSQPLEDMYYVENFKEWTNTQKQTFDSVTNDEPRIIIPLRYNGKIIGYQGRALLPKSKIKYITIMLEEDAPKVFGLDKIKIEDPVYVVEGPIDSYFLGNAIAMCGSDVDLSSYDYQFIFAFDNEPRSRQIVDKIAGAIRQGAKVVLWPKSIVEKDINDMVNAGHDVQSVVESNTFDGLQAQVKLTEWKRV